MNKSWTSCRQLVNKSIILFRFLTFLGWWVGGLVVKDFADRLSQPSLAGVWAEAELGKISKYNDENIGVSVDKL